MVHHDIWDYDNATAPKLLTIRHNGQMVDVVAQAGKTGFLYVFNRVTGEPIWPIEERPVPQTDVPGEQTWPTQPFPTNPPPFARQSFTEKDLSPFIEDPAERARFLEDIRGARNEGLFTPPGLTQHDPDARQQRRRELRRRRRRSGARHDVRRVEGLARAAEAEAAAGRRRRARRPTRADGLRYRERVRLHDHEQRTDGDCAAVDVADRVRPEHGHDQMEDSARRVPELAAKGFKDTGSHFPKVGPVVTAGGLIFTGTRDRKIRALDVDTGKVLWTVEVDAGVEGIPAVYEVNGKQYLVYCAAAQRPRTRTRRMIPGPGHDERARSRAAAQRWWRHPART